MSKAVSPGNRILLRLTHRDGVNLPAVVSPVIADAGGSICSMDMLAADFGRTECIFAVDTSSQQHAEQIVCKVKELAGVDVLKVSDCTFKMHEGGKLDIVSKAPLRDYVDLSMAYTPGVARVCQAIHEDPSAARKYTIRRNTVAVITDGTAVLGLGNIGATAALPVMEGKAVLFKEFGGVNAFPICVDTTDTEVLIETARAIAATFGGINLEDIAAPRCFEVERRVTESVDIPVFHDDQHGTAVVVGSAFINSVKLTGKNPADMRGVVLGAGAAGVACTRALMDLGIGDVVVCDRQGAIYRGRDDKTPSKAWLAEQTNKQNLKDSMKEVLVGADLFLGLSGPNLLSGEDMRVMASNPIIFALSNPTPEVPPEEVADFAAVVATGRSDYPNQINNVLCFPGLFKGILDSGVKRVTREMLTAAARAIASAIEPSELRPDYIIPSAFDKNVAQRVTKAVMDVAADQNVAKTPIYFDF